MREAKFKIGDLVETNWNGIGKVADVMYSSHKDQYTYEAVNDEDGSFLFNEDELALAPPQYSMDIKIDIANNMVIATLYESNGDLNVPIKKALGHLNQEGALGVAKATSFACRRLYKSMGGSK